uniref:ESPR-type extended signal peptide-containing protein n=1 Tax=Enterobacter bugandensis TaxID=881260 RepID=UPI002A819A28
MNAIYKVIFNRATGQPVVVSELGKGKIKSSASRKKLSLIGILSMVLATQVNASICSLATFTCVLDDTWTVSANNYGNGSLHITDGNYWNVTGVKDWQYGDTSYVTINNLNNVIGNYEVKFNGSTINSLPSNKEVLVLPSASKTISVLNPITNSYESFSVYSSDLISMRDTYEMVYGDNFMKTQASFYVKTNLIDINNGVVDISLSGSKYAIGEVRESNLVNIDGSNNNAVANWNSKQTFSIAYNTDWSKQTSDSGYKNFNTGVSTFNGKIESSDGTEHNILSLADFKEYNDWLVNKIERGEIPSSEYYFNLSKAYNTTNLTYQYSVFPAGTNANQYGSAESAIIHTTGNDAHFNVTNSGHIAVNSGSTNSFKIFLSENGSTVINDGEIISHGKIMQLLTGAKFFNNGLIVLGGTTSDMKATGGYNTTPVSIDGLGTQFINNGVYNINSRAIYNEKTKNGSVHGIEIYNSGYAVNNNNINSGYWGNNTALKDEQVGGVFSVLVSDSGSFVNSVTGRIRLGVSEDGAGLDYLSSGSAAIKVNNDGSAINEGLISLESTADGVYGFLANGVNLHIANSGTIQVNSDGDNGLYTPSQSIGIFSQNAASGNIINSGVIVLSGSNNVGIKSIGGAKAISSGSIIVNKASANSVMRNYGVWVEGTNSEVEVSGSINLNGDNAIGAHARNRGTINITGNAAINFISGKKQIGYFVYGVGSQINNSSSSVQDVSSDASTLMRLDGGATFSGSATSGSLMVASGQDSLILLATGTGTSVSTGSMTFDLSGRGTTGILIEGGATGMIDAGTILQLNNASAIAAIADGNGHDLNGAVSISGDTSTKLVSSAVLSSDKDRVTGYIARNGATLDNSGNMSFTGADTTGLAVLDGSRGINSGSITVSDGSVGLIANSSNQKTVIDNTGDLTLKGGSAASRTTGISASGNAVTVNMTGGTISLEGQGAVGVKVTDGASVNLAGTALPVFANQGAGVSNQIAFLISGAGSTLHTNTTSVMDASGKASTLFRIENGASQQGVLTYDVSGENARGIWATGAGTQVNAASGSHVSIQGSGAQGIYVAGGASAALEQGVTAALTGSGAVVGVVDGNEYDLAGSVTATNTGTVLTNEADISSGLAGATAFITQNQGMLV